MNFVSFYGYVHMRYVDSCMWMQDGHAIGHMCKSDVGPGFSALLETGSLCHCVKQDLYATV